MLNTVDRCSAPRRIGPKRQPPWGSFPGRKKDRILIFSLIPMQFLFTDIENRFGFLHGCLQSSFYRWTWHLLRYITLLDCLRDVFATPAHPESLKYWIHPLKPLKPVCLYIVKSWLIEECRCSNFQLWPTTRTSRVPAPACCALDSRAWCNWPIPTETVFLAAYVASLSLLRS